MPFKPKKGGVPYGRMQAARQGGGLLDPKFRDALEDFQRFPDKETRAAFADKWVRLTASRMDDAWTAFYELLRVIRDERLFETAEFMEDRKARASFKEYWEQVVQKPFRTWLELETTYHFVREHAPELLKGTLGEATKYRKGQAAAEKTTKDQVGPRGGSKSKLDFETKSDRAEGNKVSHYTQAKIDSLASKFPDLHRRVVAGELSVHAAAVQAGIATPTFTVAADPIKAARVLVKRFTAEGLDALLAEIERLRREPAS